MTELEKVVNDFKSKIASRKSIVGNEREIRPEGAGILWSISNLSDHASNLTAPINSVDHAIEIIEKVAGYKIDKAEFNSRFTLVDRSKQMYLHLL